jgi:nucleoside 2-deoxyribosyltransferase
MKKIYLASPLGFSSENSAYLNSIKNQLAGQNFEIFDPWEKNHFDSDIEEAMTEQLYVERVAAFRRVASKIGACNEDGIREADMLLAVLDGAEVDSGTASEVGFASALGKKCYALRTDLRNTGDFIGIPFNLQVLHFVERSGGRLFRSIAEISINP